MSTPTSPTGDITPGLRLRLRTRTRLMRVLRLAITRIPPAIGNPTADCVGYIIYMVARKSRRNAIDNMRHVLGPSADRKRLKQVVRGVFRNVMRNYYDLCRVPELGRERLHQIVGSDAPGWDQIVELQHNHRAVIIATLHFGSFDVMTNFITLKGMRLTALIAQIKPAWLSDFITTLRGAGGMDMVMVDEEEGGGLNLTALKQVVSLLRAGEMVGLVADRNMEPYGVEIPFFGHRTLVAAGVAKLALRTKAVIVPAFCYRLPGNRYSLTFEEPIYPHGSAANEDDVRAILLHIFGRFEYHIGRAPEQWVLLQPVWRR